MYYRLTRRPGRGYVKLHERDSSDIWQSFSGLRRTAVADKLFERPVSKAGRTVDRLDERDRVSHNDQKTMSPITIKGSGGQHALALPAEDATSSSYGTAQPTRMLAQLFGGTFASRSSSQDSQGSVTDERFTALEAKLDKIEEMVSRLVTGGLSLEGNDG